MYRAVLPVKICVACMSFTFSVVKFSFVFSCWQFLYGLVAQVFVHLKYLESEEECRFTDRRTEADRDKQTEGDGQIQLNRQR